MLKPAAYIYTTEIDSRLYDILTDHDDNYPKLAVELNTVVYRAKNDPKQLARDLYALFDK